MPTAAQAKMSFLYEPSAHTTLFTPHRLPEDQEDHHRTWACQVAETATDTSSPLCIPFYGFTGFSIQGEDFFGNVLQWVAFFADRCTCNPPAFAQLKMINLDRS